MKKKSPIRIDFRHDRRKFLKRGASLLTGAYLGFFAPRFVRMAPRATPSSNMQYRELGRTGLKISEVGFGGYPISDPDVVRYALDQGINYFDTAWDYRNGLSEEAIGAGLEGRRDAAVITTKWHPWSYTKVPEMMEMLNTSLRRLKTDYVDCLLVHQVGKASGGEAVERLQNQELFKAMELAKRQGKVRFFGCSGHDEDLMAVMNYAVTIPEFSVFLNRINFRAYPGQPEFFQQVRAKGLGMTVMKTLSGARHADLKPFQGEKTTYRQASLKWVLSNPDISGLVISISSREQVDEFMLASGGKS